MAKRRRRITRTQNRFREPESRTILDIIIPVYNQFDLLERCLDSIPDAMNGISFNVIVVDNNSSYAERDKFYRNRTDITLIQNSNNLGFSRACNKGAARKNSPLLFFLNSDVILSPNSLEHLIKEMDNPEIGVSGMLLQFPEYSEDLNPAIRPANKVQHVGMETNVHGRWFHMFIGWSIDHPKVLARRNAYAVTGAAMMTRRNIWNQVGGFFEEYGLGTYEDVDYCMSVRQLGYNIIVDTKAHGIHYVGATLEREKLQYPMSYNRFVFLQRWAQNLEWSEWQYW